MRLKKRHMLMGLWVAAATVSCSNDQVIDDLRPAGGNETDGISFVVADQNTRGGSFGNRPGSSTRASVTTTDNITNNSFAVYGDMTSLDDSSKKIRLFNGEEVSHDGSQWTYTNTRYWFPNYDYAFAAVHPMLDGKTAIQNLKYTDNSLSFTYSPSTYRDGVDIMTATHRRNSNTATTAVNFEFHHILSRINFKAKVDQTSVNDIIITKLTLVNVPTKAEYTITGSPTGTNTNDYTENWSDFLDKQTNSTPFNLSNAVTVAKGTTKEFFPMDAALMVIPQEVPDDVELLIEYKVGENGSIKTGATKLKNLTISAHNGVWEMGKAYTYSFTLGDNESIIFNVPTVQDWNEAEGGNYVITD